MKTRDYFKVQRAIQALAKGMASADRFPGAGKFEAHERDAEVALHVLRKLRDTDTEAWAAVVFGPDAFYVTMRLPEGLEVEHGTKLRFFYGADTLSVCAIEPSSKAP